MKIKFETKCVCQWHEEFMCICYMEDMSSRLFSLSKRKMLKYLYELETLDEIHILLLNTLSTVTRITYYMTDNNFTIYMLDDEENITFKMPLEIFDDIVLYCIYKQYK